MTDNKTQHNTTTDAEREQIKAVMDRARNKTKVEKGLSSDLTQSSNAFKIVFRCNNLDSEELRECIEDKLGVEILSIERCENE